MNKLKLLQLKIQSLNSDSKKIQLASLTQIHKPDFISINETYLKPQHVIELKIKPSRHRNNYIKHSEQ